MGWYIVCTYKIIPNILSVEIGSILLWLTMFTIINVAQAFRMSFVLLLGTMYAGHPPTFGRNKDKCR